MYINESLSKIKGPKINLNQFKDNHNSIYIYQKCILTKSDQKWNHWKWTKKLKQLIRTYRNMQIIKIM